MASEIERELRAKIREVTRTELQNAVNKVSELKDQIHRFCITWNLPIPYYCRYDRLVVRINSKGELIIADTHSKNKVELAEVGKLIEYYTQELKDLSVVLDERKEIKRIEELLIRAVGEERWAWYRSKTDPHQDP